jgi:biopolymer transport protein ExbB/TolQ
MSTLTDLAKDQMKAEPELSFDRSDIERRVGFPAGRFTSAGPLLPLLVGVILTVAFYAILAFLPESDYKDMFTKRGVVQYVIMFFSFWAGMVLIVKNSKLSLQRKALSINLLPAEDPGFVLTPASAQNILENLYRKVDDPERFILTKRIHNALANLRNIGRVGDVDEILRTAADNDEGVADSSYTTVRGLIWAIPVLGFIGTVQGLSQALGSFWGVVSHSNDVAQMRSALQGVTNGLATAFETTLVGLVAALAIHLVMILLKRREEQFLDQCKDYCQKYVVGRLRLTAVQEDSQE